MLPDIIFFGKPWCDQTFANRKWPALDTNITATEGPRHLWSRKRLPFKLSLFVFWKIKGPFWRCCFIASCDNWLYQQTSARYTSCIHYIYWKLFFVGFLHSFHIWEGSLPSMNLFKHNFLKLCRFKFTQIMIRGGGA